MDRVDFFNKHASRWDDLEVEDIGLCLARVVSLSESRQGERILDVGTGTGVLIPHILKVVGSQGSITAVDISPEMIAVAQTKGFPENVEFLQADVQETGLPDNSFNRVICNAAFPHFADKLRALLEMIRMLRPGGTLVISHPIGREAVNNLHRDVSPVVAEDRVPTAGKMREMLEDAGLVNIHVFDEPNFYLASSDKAI
ncbi:MAG: class I SAM-dependent methyltransferase [Armatimonadota bacterium]